MLFNQSLNLFKMWHIQSIVELEGLFGQGSIPSKALSSHVAINSNYH